MKENFNFSNWYFISHVQRDFTSKVMHFFVMAIESSQNHIHTMKMIAEKILSTCEADNGLWLQM